MLYQLSYAREASSVAISRLSALRPGASPRDRRKGRDSSTCIDSSASIARRTRGLGSPSGPAVSGLARGRTRAAPRPAFPMPDSRLETGAGPALNGNVLTAHPPTTTKTRVDWLEPSTSISATTEWVRPDYWDLGD